MLIRIDNTTLEPTHHEFGSTDFDVDALVHERMTPFFYDPKTGRAWQRVRGHKVALTSYEAFGADLHQARLAAEHWCRKAQAAWNAYTAMS